MLIIAPCVCRTAIPHDICELVMMFLPDNSFSPRDAIDEELCKFFLPVVASATRICQIGRLAYAQDPLLKHPQQKRNREEDIQRKKRLGRAKSMSVSLSVTHLRHSARCLALPKIALTSHKLLSSLCHSSRSATIANLAAAENTNCPYPSCYLSLRNTPVRAGNPVPTPVSAPVPTSAKTQAKKQENFILHALPLK
jgi:hypothetical protein